MPETIAPVLVAAIDVGSSAIRMDISEIHSDGTFRTLETLTKGVSLGKDAFATGMLGEETMQTACQALIDFQQLMKTYGVLKYRAVATSALREAKNADTLIDRAYMRSGIEIEVIDGSEQNRLTYMAIDNTVHGVLDLQTQNVLVVEIGGGSTDLSFLKAGELLHSGTFALGAVRLRQDLSSLKGDLKHRIKILDRQVKNMVDTIAKNIPFDEVQEIIALGGDIRFAARQIVAANPGEEKNFWIVNKKDFAKLCQEVSRYDTDELVRSYALSYPQAETLVPALIGYRNIFERTKAERLHVLSVSIRAGLLLDMARREFGKGLESFERQILASARAVAQKYRCNENHTEQVRMLSLSLFDQLQLEHGLERRERLFLEVAAVLHDVGAFISNRSHHKHSYYIVSSSEVFGLSRTDLNIIANVARYHRKSMPMASHIPYISLDRESRMIVSKLAAILRVADALDHDYSKKVRKVKVVSDPENSRYILEAEAEGDLSIEGLSMERKSDLFHAIYGKPIVLRQVDKLE